MLRKVQPGEAVTAALWNALIDEIQSRTISVDPASMRMFRMPMGTLLASLAGGAGTKLFYGKLDNQLYNESEGTSGVYVTPIEDYWFGSDPGTDALFVYNIPQTIDAGYWLFEAKANATCFCIYSPDRDKWYFVWVQCSTADAPAAWGQAA